MSAETTKAIEDRLTKLEAENTDLKTNNEAQRRATILADAKRDGQVIPLSAEKVKTVDIDVLEDIVKELPKGVVPLESEVEGADDSTTSFNAEAMTSDLKSCAAQLDLSEDDLKKYA